MSDRPEIYNYLDKQFGMVHDKINKQGIKLAKVEMAVENIEKQYKPNPSCIKFIDEKVDAKVGKFTFWSVTTAITGLIGFIAKYVFFKGGN